MTHNTHNEAHLFYATLTLPLLGLVGSANSLSSHMPYSIVAADLHEFIHGLNNLSTITVVDSTQKWWDKYICHCIRINKLEAYDGILPLFTLRMPNVPLLPILAELARHVATADRDQFIHMV